MTDEEARFTRSVGLSFGALWIAVIAMKALTFAAPAGDTPRADEILARAAEGPVSLVQVEPRIAISRDR